MDVEQSWRDRPMLRALWRLRERLGPLWWHTAIVFVGSRLSDLINLYLGLFFLPKSLSVHELGAVDPIIRLVALASAPLTVVSLVATNYISSFCATRSFGKVKHMFRDLAWLAFGASVAAVIGLACSYEFFSVRLGFGSLPLTVGLYATCVISCWRPMLVVMLQGTQRYQTSVVAGLADAVVRLVLAIALVRVFGLAGYLLSLCVGGVCQMWVGARGLKEFTAQEIPAESYYQEWREMLRFAVPVTVFVLADSIQEFVEPFVVKHFLSSMDAAGYYMMRRLAGIPILLVGAISFVLFPILSHRHKRNEDTGGYLLQSLTVMVVVCTLGGVILGFAAPWLLERYEGWRQFVGYAEYVWGFCLLFVFQSAVSVYVMHEIACRRFSFLWVYIPVATAQSLLLYVTLGWGALRDVLPGPVWEAVDQVIRRDLGFVVMVGCVAKASIAVGFAVHWWTVVRKRGGR